MGMADPQYYPVSEIKSRFSAIMAWVQNDRGRVVITKHGRPTVVMLSFDELEAIEKRANARRRRT